MCHKDLIMQKLGFKFIFIFIGIISVLSCAKRGNITGGLKDSLSPVLISSSPKNGAVNFSGNQIKIYFNEYVKLKNVGKQLVVSPPMERKPEVLPYNASKYIIVKIKDTLKPNTTYSLNFGQSIEDNNEGNVLNQFKFVFSTGNFIDSLNLKTTIKDAYENKKPDFVSIMLYEKNEKFNDSLIYKQTPTYITNTLDGLTMTQLENLRKGLYRLVAVKDLNNNNKFDPKTEKIGFIKDFVSIPNDTVFELELFKEIVSLKFNKPSQVSGSKFIVGFEGNAENSIVETTLNGSAIKSIVTKMPKKDSLQLWLPKIKNDSVVVTLSKNNRKQIFKLKVKDQKIDSLQVTTDFRGTVAFRKKFNLICSTPIEKIDESKIEFLDKDSLKVKFKTSYDTYNQLVVVDFEKKPSDNYKFKALPGALIDLYDQKNDTLKFNFSTQATSDYGNLRVQLQKVNRYPVIVELTDEKGIALESQSLSSGTEVFFDLIEPKKYTLRLIYDDNKNQIWDSGNFIEKRQSEEVIYFPKEIDVRANWDVEQPFDVGK